ncbi:hypothetical protein LMG27177_02240 [Paraburkholderia fynbosensis]|uniref:Uncharacterized protein n=1 Tax=Paraburkholderia fynbosensis TaxID=1200993 RepID=A0A6J5FZ20_9BURK|nr:hypothetical protein LMG27177_02240 [Paraburkholderia fynbosensis]
MIGRLTLFSVRFASDVVTATLLGESIRTGFALESSFADEMLQ